MIDYLVDCNYRWGDLWDMTPKQLAACLALAQRRKMRGDAKSLAINALAAQGKADDVNRHISEWSK